MALSERYLAGPLLVAFICALSQRMRLSRARVREFLSEWLGLALSIETINQCLHEAGRVVGLGGGGGTLPGGAQCRVELLSADETN